MPTLPAGTGLLGRIPEGDALRELPVAIRVALVEGLGVSNVQMLMVLPDKQILSVVRDAVGCGERGVAELSEWLCRQRAERGDAVVSSVDAKVRADRLMSQARSDITAAVREVIDRDGLSAQEVARWCGTSTKAIESVIDGGGACYPGSGPAHGDGARSAGEDFGPGVTKPERAVFDAELFITTTAQASSGIRSNGSWSLSAASEACTDTDND